MVKAGDGNEDGGKHFDELGIPADFRLYSGGREEQVQHEPLELPRRIGQPRGGKTMGGVLFHCSQNQESSSLKLVKECLCRTIVRDSDGEVQIPGETGFGSHGYG